MKTLLDLSGELNWGEESVPIFSGMDTYTLNRSYWMIGATDLSMAIEKTIRSLGSDGPQNVRILITIEDEKNSKTTRK